MTPLLVSVCVPIYNVSPYIERCVRSLMEQTYSNLEYVFVDDGSTDDSLAILKRVVKEYPSRQGQVKIVHNDKNHGLAYTRRVSIEQAQGVYIWCVDSDDYVEPQAIQCMVDKATQTDADIVSVGYYIEYATPERVTPPVYDELTDYIQLALYGQLTPVWNKLIRRSLYTDGPSAYAPEGLDYMEDRMMMLFLSTKIQYMVSINQPLYHYVVRDNSVSQNISEKHWRCIIRYWEETERRLDELGLRAKYSEMIGKQKVQTKAFHFMYCDNPSRKQFVDLYAEEERLYMPKLSRGVALMYWLTKHHLWTLTYWYRRYIKWLEHKKEGK